MSVFVSDNFIFLSAGKATVFKVWTSQFQLLTNMGMYNTEHHTVHQLDDKQHLNNKISRINHRNI